MSFSHNSLHLVICQCHIAVTVHAYLTLSRLSVLRRFLYLDKNWRWQSTSALAVLVNGYNPHHPPLLDTAPPIRQFRVDLYFSRPLAKVVSVVLSSTGVRPVLIHSLPPIRYDYRGDSVRRESPEAENIMISASATYGFILYYIV